MKATFVGIGNTGKEYEKTRHNAGRDIVLHFHKKFGEGECEYKKLSDALIGGGEGFVSVLPETYVNKSGFSVGKLVKSKASAKHMLVVRDDLDLPVGTMKMTFARGSGGHKGVESIMRALKTEEFYQLKVGVSPKTASGKIKKVQGEDKVEKLVLGKFSPTEQEVMKKVFKKALEVLALFLVDKEKSQQLANTK